MSNSNLYPYNPPDTANMSSSASRKRPAPGSSPAVPPGQTMAMRPQSQAYQQSPEQLARWNNVAGLTNAYNASEFDMFSMNPQQPQQPPQQPAMNAYQPQIFSPAPPQQQQQQLPQQQQQQQMYQQPRPHPQNMSSPGPSNMIARRTDNASRALVPSRPTYQTQPDAQWPSNENALVPALNPVDTEQRQLEEAIAKARKIEEEAQSERPGAPKKSIPPFVQKLATFLDRGTDHGLIRWSDKGDSFFVLDEDEFARTLIPQLFKHSNYASFVRQLNMYGFHKRVGLADNSMRSSEKKNKAPSEYAHQYFRRDLAILQWLINKPNKKKMDAEKRKATGGKRDDTYDIDSDDDDEEPQQVHAAPGTVFKTDLSRIRDQLQDLTNKHMMTQKMLKSMQADQGNLLNKARQVEAQYSRHDTTINQILGFLANLFRKSLDGKNAEALAEIMQNILPNQNQGAGNPTGSVEDLGDNQQQRENQRGALSPVPRHHQHLLLGPEGTSATTSGYQVPSVAQGSPQQTSRVTELPDTSPEDTTSPNDYNPQEAIMKLMTMNSGMDLPEVAANTPPSMPTEERRRMHHSMPQHPQARQQSAPVANGNQSNVAYAPAPALNNTVPSSLFSESNVKSPNSLALSPGPVTSFVEDVNTAQDQFQQIEKNQNEVEEGIQDLVRYTALLTPNGRLPEVNGGPDDYFSANLTDADFGNQFDIDTFLNQDPSLFANTSDPSGFDFGPTNYDASQLGVEWNQPQETADIGSGHLDIKNASANAHDTPSPTVTEEIERADLDEDEMPAAKRQRGL